MAEPQRVGSVTTKGSAEGRYEFRHEGQLIYEWEQTLEEVNLYVTVPEGVVADMIECAITPKRLRLGIRGNPPFLDEDTWGPVVQGESYWTLDGRELTILLQKMRKGETWDAALRGRGTVDPVTRQQIQKDMMLERFQEENPGFDFRGADFNGAVPDPRTFMDGVKYS
mmetsp:Transcript_7641/g.23610  ORF Transcript_7641/g.23610 Transcript_7641/m.23610 type:complete len:168 (+) Transcript_7641:121-624(+)